LALLPGEAGKKRQKSLLELIWTVKPVGTAAAVVVAMVLVAVAVVGRAVVLVLTGPLHLPEIQSSWQSA
jgi:hypothetical protein